MPDKSKIIGQSLKIAFLTFFIASFYFVTKGTLAAIREGNSIPFLIELIPLLALFISIQIPPQLKKLYLLEDEAKKIGTLAARKNFDRFRTRLRLHADISTSLSVFGTLFSMAIAFIAFDAANVDARTNTLLDSYQTIQARLGPLCKDHIPSKNYSCAAYPSALNSMYSLEQKGDDPEELGNQISKFEISVRFLSHNLDNDGRTQIDSALKRIDRLRPINGLAVSFISLLVSLFLVGVGGRAAVNQVAISLFEARYFSRWLGRPLARSFRAYWSLIKRKWILSKRTWLGRSRSKRCT